MIASLYNNTFLSLQLHITFTHDNYYDNFYLHFNVGSLLLTNNAQHSNSYIISTFTALTL